MRYFFLATMVMLGLLAVPAIAEPPEKGGDRPDRGDRREQLLKEHDKDGDGKLSEEEREAARAAHHEKMVKEFDKDGDGKLSEDERQAAREAMRERFGIDRPGALGGRRGDRGPGPGPDGPRGPGGPGRPPGRPPLPPPGELFEKFDADKNDSLSREEFMKLTEFVREHRPMGPPPWGPDGPRGFRGPGGRGPDGRSPDGPPPPPRDGDRPPRWREGGPPRGDRPRDGERRRGDRDRDRDREGRPDAPPPADRDDGDQENKGEKPENESA